MAKEQNRNSGASEAQHGTSAADSSDSAALLALIPDPIGLIEEEHELQLTLCDLLETLADGLPDQADRNLARGAAHILRSGMPEHMKLEEETFFPLVRERAADDSALLAMLERLEDEHAGDGDLASEIADELQLLADFGHIRNAEMLGYMLRGYFEGQRRHIAWENKVVLPLARRVLSESDLAELRARLAREGRPAITRQLIDALRQA